MEIPSFTPKSVSGKSIIWTGIIVCYLVLLRRYLAHESQLTSLGLIGSFIGYSNLNYALSEVKHPVKTLKRALPICISIIAVLYILVNIVFFAAIPKEEILTSNRLVAALFMRNMFGESAEKAISVLIALSAIGNVLAVLVRPSRHRDSRKG